VHNVRQWPNLRHLGESLGELKACRSSGFKFYMALDARLPADWVQTGDPRIQGSIYLTTGLLSSTHLQPVFLFLNVSTIFVTSSASKFHVPVLHMTVALSAWLSAPYGTNYLLTSSPLTLYQFSVLDSRFICLLMPMRRNCNVASASVSYFSFMALYQSILMFLRPVAHDNCANVFIVTVVPRTKIRNFCLR